MARLLKSLFIFLLIVSLHFVFAAPSFAQGTQTWQGVCVDSVDGVATIQGVQCLVGNVLQIAISGIGFAGFVMLIFGSFTYLLSGGNAKGVDEGRKTMTYAVAGLVVALSSYFILNIIADFTGVESILTFSIPDSETQFETPPKRPDSLIERQDGF